MTDTFQRAGRWYVSLLLRDGQRLTLAVPPPSALVLSLRGSREPQPRSLVCWLCGAKVLHTRISQAWQPAVHYTPLCGRACVAGGVRSADDDVAMEAALAQAHHGEDCPGCREEKEALAELQALVPPSRPKRERALTKGELQERLAELEEAARGVFTTLGTYYPSAEIREQYPALWQDLCYLAEVLGFDLEEESE